MYFTYLAACARLVFLLIWVLPQEMLPIRELLWLILNGLHVWEYFNHAHLPERQLAGYNIQGSKWFSLNNLFDIQNILLLSSYGLYYCWKVWCQFESYSLIIFILLEALNFSLFVMVLNFTIMCVGVEFFLTLFGTLFLMRSFISL